MRLFITYFVLSFLLISPAIAEGLDIFDIGSNNSVSVSNVPEETDPFFISMVFHRFSGTLPDFREMAKNSDEYKATPDKEKIYMIEEKIEEYRSIYNLINMAEPLVVSTNIKLSDYNEKIGGFLIDNFKDGLFFPVSSLGKNYALIPEGIMDQQWMSVKDKDLGKKIEKYTALGALTRQPVKMFLYITPLYADAKESSKIEGKDYWLMAVKINSMKLYSPELDEILWEYSNTPETDNEKLNDLMHLK